MPHTCTRRHSVSCELQLTSSSSKGSIIGASSALGERAGDEDSLFSHSVMPGVLLPVSRKERFSSLMFVWCLTISAGGSVSCSSRSTMIQTDEGRVQREKERRPCFLFARVACISSELSPNPYPLKWHKMQLWQRSAGNANSCRPKSAAFFPTWFPIQAVQATCATGNSKSNSKPHGSCNQDRSSLHLNAKGAFRTSFNSMEKIK